MKVKFQMEKHQCRCQHKNTIQQDFWILKSQFIKATLLPKLGLWVWPEPFSFYVRSAKGHG
jgi:hypothetical protein